MSTQTSFRFRRGNLAKLLSIPGYALGFLLSLFVTRLGNQWVFGSGIGVGEGALAVAKELQKRDGDALIIWLTETPEQAAEAETFGFESKQKRSWAGFWATLRAGTIVVTHGLGDAHRFGLFGATVVNLWHGAPLKKLHLDSRVTTEVGGGRAIKRLLGFMYRKGASQVDVYAAGSPIAAQRLRSAFRVQPGMVQVLGDARLDELARNLADPAAAARKRLGLVERLGLSEAQSSRRWVLYAPTWRDGAVTAGIPTPEEAVAVASWARTANVQLFLRSHPLGQGDYEHLVGENITLVGSDVCTEITPMLGLFDALMTDYSSIAIDFALTGRPIVWFAPDLDDYTRTRGLYEPYEVTTEGHFAVSWRGALKRLESALAGNPGVQRAAVLRTQRLAARFHEFRDGNSAARVLDYVQVLHDPARNIDTENAVFFESFYGSLATCNPLAIDAELAKRYPALTRYWSVANEGVQVPHGAVALLVGSPEWHAARRHAKLLVVNDWLRFDFTPRKDQFVLQTWHGTPLKRLALDRPGQSLRTRLAVRRESKRWSALLSQNAHATEALKRSYAFRGPIIETGYPRNDRLALAEHQGERLLSAQSSARQRLGLGAVSKVLFYAPTWREHGRAMADTLDVARLADQLGSEWTILARGHSREMGQPGYSGARVHDVTRVADVNDLLLAADVFVTDYSSLMFDASVASIATVLFVADREEYLEAERGFTFALEEHAPGPLVTSHDEMLEMLRAYEREGNQAAWIVQNRVEAKRFSERFNAYDDGRASARVVDWLENAEAIPTVS
ncbi:CDP-glycerol glycerophosphotransferase family protein [Leucobacter chinensis]|uniref:CDP-glycerol glycerophosphotransferase family protein n=1 Tax=Leucobacter chinensis TaxID=2851010 RepID=UPI001C2245AD